MFKLQSEMLELRTELRKESGLRSMHSRCHLVEIPSCCIVADSGFGCRSGKFQQKMASKKSLKKNESSLIENEDFRF